MVPLDDDAAIEAVAASIRRLFAAANDRQARDLARVVLRDLAARGMRLGIEEKGEPDETPTT